MQGMHKIASGKKCGIMKHIDVAALSLEKATLVLMGYDSSFWNKNSTITPSSSVHGESVNLCGTPPSGKLVFIENIKRLTATRLVEAGDLTTDLASVRQLTRYYNNAIYIFAKMVNFKLLLAAA